MSRAPSHLTPAQLEELRGRLLALRREAEDELARDREEAKIAGASREVGDDEDRATETAALEGALEETVRDARRFEAIRAALRRIEDGTYGVCELTGAPIPYARLRVEPTARYSIEAQEALDRDADLARSRAVGDEDLEWAHTAATVEEEAEDRGLDTEPPPPADEELHVRTGTPPK